MLVHRTMLMQASQVELARTLAATLAGSAGANMWSVALSADGSSPATYWEDTGWLDDSFALLMPLHSYTQDESGSWTRQVVSEGQPEVVLAMAEQAGLQVTLEEILAVFAAADVTEDEWPVARNRLGLQAVIPEEIQQ